MAGFNGASMAMNISLLSSLTGENETSSFMSASCSSDWGDVIRQAGQPSLLMFSDQPCPTVGGYAISDMVKALGFRLLDMVAISEATERLSWVVDVDAVFVQCSGREPGLDLLLARLDTMAINQCMDLVISVDMDGVDHVHSILKSDRAIMLCEPESNDLAAVLGAVAAMPEDRERLCDIGREESNDPRIDKLSDELGRLSRTIEALVQNRTPTQFAPPANQNNGATVHSPVRAFNAYVSSNDSAEKLPRVSAPTARQVRALLRARRQRETIFADDIFADPAWDILLDLMAARLENTRVSVSSLCIAAVVPPTTALRWIRQLTEKGLLERQADPDDGRRIFITLSEAGQAAMTRWFQEGGPYLAQALGAGPITGAIDG